MLETLRGPHGSPIGSKGGPRSCLEDIWEAPGSALDTILADKSVTRSPTRLRNASLELNSDADAVSDQEIRKSAGNLKKPMTRGRQREVRARCTRSQFWGCDAFRPDGGVEARVLFQGRRMWP